MSNPPTPTIQEQLDDILNDFKNEIALGYVSEKEVYPSLQEIAKAKEQLTLLVTKAEQNARLDELTYVHIRDNMLYTSAPDDGADHTINDRIAQLKELTQ